LTERLSRKGFTEDVVSDTIYYLKLSGYLDDEALAHSLKRQAFAHRLLGYYGAKRLLLKRGISKEIVNASLDYNEELELTNAKKLLKKKIESTGSDISFKERRKLWNFLVRRGYSLSVVRNAFKDCNLSDGSI
jgi:regulatory protein